MSTESFPTLDVPRKWRALVYIVGMLGFPAVVSAYILVVLSTDMKQVDRSITSLATRIDERPMSIEKSTDFIVYITDSLRGDLQAGYPELVSSLSLSSKKDKKSLQKALSIVKREIEGYVRPIVRKHQRFAARFPTEGGNLGSLFRLSSFAVDIEKHEAEAYMRGRATQEFSEALVAMLTNNIFQFGDLDSLEAGDEDLEKAKAAIEEILGKDVIEGNETKIPIKLDAASAAVSEANDIFIIEQDLFLRLSLDSIETATTVLRDQMLEQLRLSGTRPER